MSDGPSPVGERAQLAEQRVLILPCGLTGHGQERTLAAVKTSIRRITNQDPLYPQACELRDRVLLTPIGYSMEQFKADYPAVDTLSDHFVAVMDHPIGAEGGPNGGGSRGGVGEGSGGSGGPRVVGVVVLVPPEGLKDGSAGIGKLMQMAVEPQLQGSGIGRQLVAVLEAHAFGVLGYSSLFCHARIEAARFYERMGWQIEGEIFEEAGIEHYRMVQAPSSAADPEQALG